MSERLTADELKTIRQDINSRLGPIYLNGEEEPRADVEALLLAELDAVRAELQQKKDNTKRLTVALTQRDEAMALVAELREVAKHACEWAEDAVLMLQEPEWYLEARAFAARRASFEETQP